jgi:hypothetical protein
MFPTLLLAVCLSASSTTPAPSSEDLESYQAARAKLGRDPSAHIRLALWCEAHGLDAERTRHLAIAVLIDPKNATARGLMGLAAYRGAWLRPEAIQEKVKSNDELTAKLAEYHRRRGQMADTADAHWKLALWCEEQGLEAETVAHLTAVTQRDPGRDAAWIRLGCKKHGGRWVSDARLAAEKEESEAEKKADRHWKPLLLKWKGWLSDPARRADAEDALRQFNEPRAVRSV